MRTSFSGPEIGAHRRPATTGHKVLRDLLAKKQMALPGATGEGHRSAQVRAERSGGRPSAVEGPPAERARLDYEAALAAFTAGRWDDARQQLARLPRDGAATFLQEHMARNPAGPPAGWDGTVALDAK